MSSTPLIETFMPTSDAREFHQIDVEASASSAYAAIRRLDLASSPISAILLVIRGIPHFLTRKASISRHVTLDSLLDLGFVALEERPNEELLLGAVGKFWRLDSGLIRVTKQEFIDFDEPGYVKATMNFAVEEHDPTLSTISTETRVVATDEDARKKFLRYWRVIGPFSGFIRSRILNTIKKDVEGDRALLDT